MCRGRCQQKPIDVCKARLCETIHERRSIFSATSTTAGPIRSSAKSDPTTGQRTAFHSHSMPSVVVLRKMSAVYRTMSEYLDVIGDPSRPEHEHMRPCGPERFDRHFIDRIALEAGVSALSGKWKARQRITRAKITVKRQSKRDPIYAYCSRTPLSRFVAGRHVDDTMRYCPMSWCNWRRVTASSGWSGGGQLAIAGRLDGGIIAQSCDGFQRHVTGALDGSFVVLFGQDCIDEEDDGVLIGKMPTISVRRLISPLSPRSGWWSAVRSVLGRERL